MIQGKLHKYQYFLMMAATGLSGIVTYQMLSRQIGSGAWIAAAASAAVSSFMAGGAARLLHGRRMYTASLPVFIALGVLLITLYAGGRSFWELLPVIVPAVYTALKGERVAGRAATVFCAVILLIYAVVLCVMAAYAEWGALSPSMLLPSGTLWPSVIKAVLINFAILLPAAMHSSCLEDRRGAAWLTVGGAALGLGTAAIVALGNAVTLGQDYSLISAGYVRTGMNIPYTLAGSLALAGETAVYRSVTIGAASAVTMAYRIGRQKK